ncbi:MAG TPA: VWA domain-containing protein [Terriglobales bacterium]
MSYKNVVIYLGFTLCLSNAFADSVPVIRKSVSEVRFPLVASDKYGRSLPALAPADISVLEDGHAISNFDVRPAQDNPLQVGILLDLSYSTEANWRLMQSAVTKFIQESVRPPDQTLLLAFDTKIEVEKAISHPEEVKAAISPLSAGGPTAFYDAVYHACQNSMFKDGGVSARSALIVFSDGEDNLSLHNLNDSIAAAQSGGIAVYTISIHKQKVRKPADEILQQLAVATGGDSFVVRRGQDLQDALKNISEELRSYYLLYYRLPHQPERREFHRVHISPAQGAIHVLRYQGGYYTEPSE